MRTIIDNPLVTVTVVSNPNRQVRDNLDQILSREPAYQKPLKGSYSSILDALADYTVEYMIEIGQPPTIETYNTLTRLYTPDQEQQAVLYEFTEKVSIHFTDMTTEIEKSARANRDEIFSLYTLVNVAVGALSGAMVGYAADKPAAGAVLGAIAFPLYKVLLRYGSFRSDKLFAGNAFQDNLMKLKKSTIERLKATDIPTDTQT